ncbi:MAG: outer membrane receptor protein involved in Fe transport, partial [Dinoroseobacter sp.]
MVSEDEIDRLLNDSRTVENNKNFTQSDWGMFMEVRYIRLGTALLTAASFAIPSTVQAADSRRIEEVVVTAERKESSVQDTSISITAFTSEMMDDFGIRNQSDLQNLVPATTIQPYDSAVRGVGRNFR